MAGRPRAPPGPHGVTLGFDSPGRDGLGQRCLKLYVPAGRRNLARVAAGRAGQAGPDVPAGQRGSSAGMCADGEVRVHAHRRTADGQLSAHEPYAGIGPGISGTTDWTLLSGTLTMPADTSRLQIHLTLEQSGSVWHAGVLLTEVVSGSVGRLEGVLPRRRSTGGLASSGCREGIPDDPAPLASSQLEIAAARNEKEPLQLAVRIGRLSLGFKSTCSHSWGRTKLRWGLAVNVVGYVPIDYPTNYYESTVPPGTAKFPPRDPSCDGGRECGRIRCCRPGRSTSRPMRRSRSGSRWGSRSRHPGRYSGTVRLQGWQVADRSPAGRARLGLRTAEREPPGGHLRRAFWAGLGVGASRWTRCIRKSFVSWQPVVFARRR